jgi:hypothetical protein
MAHFLRGKQAGVQGDLSNGVAPELFLIDDVRSNALSHTSTVLTDSITLHSTPVMASTPKSPPSLTTLSSPFLPLAPASHTSAPASSTSSDRSGYAISSTRPGGPRYGSYSFVRTDFFH